MVGLKHFGRRPSTRKRRGGRQRSERLVGIDGGMTRSSGWSGAELSAGLLDDGLTGKRREDEGEQEESTDGETEGEVETNVDENEEEEEGEGFAADIDHIQVDELDEAVADNYYFPRFLLL